MPFGSSAYASVPFGAEALGVAAGDTFRDAFRLRLDHHIEVAELDWEAIDLVNTANNPDASTGFFYLDFIGGSEGQYTFGAPGYNLHHETGQVTLCVVAPLGRLRNTAERYAEILRRRFRMDRFAAGDRMIRITSTAPMGGGENDGGLWVETVALGYEIYNVG